MATAEIRKTRREAKKTARKAVFNSGHTIKSFAATIPFHYQSVWRALNEADPFWSQKIIDATKQIAPNIPPSASP